MDDRRNSSALSYTRMVVLALVALGASYGGAFLTAQWIARLAEAGRLPAALAPLFDPNRAPTPAWPLATAAGGIAIGLLAVGLAARVPGRRARRGAAAAGLQPPAIDTALDPESSLAWLHVVSGPSARRVGHAAAELAARWIARGERVLLIDAGPRLRLHVPLVAEPSLGVAECLQNGMPLLGVVQCVGVPGLYLLAHGGPVPPRVWAGLGRLADQARPHFDRVLLAVDLGAPYDVGRALAGRYIEAWWPDAGPERRAGAQSLAERIGIRFRGMDLGVDSKPMLELLRERIEALHVTGTPRPEQLPVGEARPAPAAPAPIRVAPLVLDCDLQVRERLRFLMWMRRLQGEQRSGTAGAPTRTSAVPQTVISG